MLGCTASPSAWGIRGASQIAAGADGKVPEYRHPVNNYRLYKLADLKKILRQLEKSVSRFSKTERQSRVR